MFICTISVFHKYGKQILDEMLQPLQLDWRSMVVLLVVDQVPGISQGRLIPFLQTDKANVAKLLKEMEEKDLLERREEEGDLRIKKLSSHFKVFRTDARAEENHERLGRTVFQRNHGNRERSVFKSFPPDWL